MRGKAYRGSAAVSDVRGKGMNLQFLNAEMGMSFLLQSPMLGVKG